MGLAVEIIVKLRVFQVALYKAMGERAAEYSDRSLSIKGGEAKNFTHSFIGC